VRRCCSFLVFGSLLLGCGRSDAEAPKAPPSAALAASSSASAKPPAGAEVPALSVLLLAPSPSPEPPPEPSIVLAAGGDVNFGRECGQEILKDPAYDPFQGLSAAWSDADLRFANLESQLSDQRGVTQSPFHRLIFTGPPGGARVLAGARISLVSTANNHAWDYGKSALFETIANLERAQVGFAGTGRDLEQAYQPHVLRAKGLSVAVFAVTQVWNQPPFDSHEGKGFVAWADVAQLKTGIEQARRDYDFVIISFHGGEEYVHAPTDRVKSFTAAMMALGVDAVIGHHPHVPQGVGFVDGRPIVYSLGDLVFAGHQERPWTLQSFFARITLKKGAPPTLSACPFRIDGHRPYSFDLRKERLAIELFRRHLVATSLYTGGADAVGPDELGCLRVTAKAPRQPPLSSSN
jgi:poly-gamma-glutamate synthesis protein (capsule biosynthesis protein)